ncbi:hypothetical protein BDV93DRAFT_506314 [Ceratobasidium sp. AG-I]|nr:hypothetical protein BDV93DRAFT_506314 [Ceratobasidium sp. AG-I]
MYESFVYALVMMVARLAKRCFVNRDAPMCRNDDMRDAICTGGCGTEANTAHRELCILVDGHNGHYDLARLHKFLRDQILKNVRAFLRPSGGVEDTERLVYRRAADPVWAEECLRVVLYLNIVDFPGRGILELSDIGLGLSIMRCLWYCTYPYRRTSSDVEKTCFERVAHQIEYELALTIVGSDWRRTSLEFLGLFGTFGVGSVSGWYRQKPAAMGIASSSLLVPQHD